MNVGGHNVTMAELKRIFEKMGLDNVETFIASGNVIFDSRKKPQALEKMISARLREALGYEVLSFLRTLPQLSAVAECRPFDSALIERAVAYNVAFTGSVITTAQHEKLAAYNTDFDAFTAHGREIHWICRVKQNESRFVSSQMEKNLGTSVTWRGINTVKRLVAKYAAPQRGGKK